jgi:hypothetical protein
MEREQLKFLVDAAAKLQADVDQMGTTLRQLQAMIPAPPPKKPDLRGQRTGVWAKIRELDATGMSRAKIAKTLRCSYTSVKQCLEYPKAGQ